MTAGAWPVFEYLCTACEVKGRGARCWLCRRTRYLVKATKVVPGSPHRHDPTCWRVSIPRSGVVTFGEQDDQPLHCPEAA